MNELWPLYPLAFLGFALLFLAASRGTKRREAEQRAFEEAVRAKMRAITASLTVSFDKPENR